MIKTFADKQTAAIFEGYQVRKLSKEIQGAARRKLKQIDSAATLDSLRVPPGNRLERLIPIPIPNQVSIITPSPALRERVGERVAACFAIR